MAEPFKNLIHAGSIREIGLRLQANEPGFDLDGFVGEATSGLEALELKARVAHVASVLRAHLAEDWPTALGQLLASLPPPLPDAEEVSSGFGLWPVLHAVQVYGLEHPQASLDALPEMTRRFSAEFTIRPYIAEVPDLAWPRIRAWMVHEDVHVRRLCSEGTRPRLPWGMRLRDSVRDPSAGLEVLDALVDDPELYVRRSVANHLNDISKDHPERAVDTARRWLERPTAHRRWVVKHALRGLVKAGHPGALDVLGFGPAQAAFQRLNATPDPAEIGASTRLVACLTPRVDQRWLVDFIVRAPRADGSLGHRIVKGKTCEVQAGEAVEVSQKLSLKRVTTRVTRPGRWGLAVQVNGQVLGETTFEVVGEAG